MGFMGVLLEKGKHVNMQNGYGKESIRSVVAGTSYGNQYL